MKKICLFILCLFINLSLFSHPWKPNHYIIIDTDGGIDDIRTITMLLASPDVRVLAVTISPGALSASNAYIKVKSLLNSFYHEGIPVGINRISNFKSPQFPFALNSVWGTETLLDDNHAPDAEKIISDILTSEKTKISFISLGSLSTAFLSFKDIPLFRTQVKEIIWSVSSGEMKEAFNYKADPSAADKIIKGDIPVKMVAGFGEMPFYNDLFIKEISKVHTPYAEKINNFFGRGMPWHAPATEHQYSYSGNDEMVAIYLHFPGLFDLRTSGSDIPWHIPGNTDSLQLAFLKIIAGETVAKNQVIKAFPLDPSFYFPDVEQSVSEIIKKYGTDEWISGVIANELHRHLGVMAIIGVKMGIRAREYYNTGVDEFSVISFAGSIPPMSCMNDGLQVSTGATAGHGLLTVINEIPVLPSAEFRYMDRKIKLTLKPEIADKISSELKEINFVYGLDSNIYWELVRKNTIKYWLNLDRHEIFDIDVIKL